MENENSAEQKTEPKSEPVAVDVEALRAAIVKALHTVYDPEIPVDIYELGLIYGIDIDEGGRVVIRMTLTAPGCPVADTLPREAEAKTRAIPGVREARVDLVWEPAWNMALMSEAARLTLGL